MLRGFTDNGELKDIKVTENGELKVAMEGGGETQETIIANTTSNPVPVNITNKQEEQKEKVGLCNIFTCGTNPRSLTVNDYISSIDIANYSDTAAVIIELRDEELSLISTFTIGSNIATTLPINQEVFNIRYMSTEDNTKFQLIVKGVMASD